VAEEHLNDAQIGTSFEAVGGERVAQGLHVLPMNSPSRRSIIATIRSVGNRSGSSVDSGGVLKTAFLCSGCTAPTSSSFVRGCLTPFSVDSCNTTARPG
jgi:hypothetical protein